MRSQRELHEWKEERLQGCESTGGNGLQLLNQHASLAVNGFQFQFRFWSSHLPVDDEDFVPRRFGDGTSRSSCQVTAPVCSFCPRFPVLMETECEAFWNWKTPRWKILIWRRNQEICCYRKVFLWSNSNGRRMQLKLCSFVYACTLSCCVSFLPEYTIYLIKTRFCNWK